MAKSKSARAYRIWENLSGAAIFCHSAAMLKFVDMAILAVLCFAAALSAGILSANIMCLCVPMSYRPKRQLLHSATTNALLICTVVLYGVNIHGWLIACLLIMWAVSMLSGTVAYDQRLPLINENALK